MVGERAGLARQKPGLHAVIGKGFMVGERVGGKNESEGSGDLLPPHLYSRRTNCLEVSRCGYTK